MHVLEEILIEPPMNPQQIAEYTHEEHTPYSQMSFEEGKKHLAELIQLWGDWYRYVYKPGEGGLIGGKEPSMPSKRPTENTTTLQDRGLGL